MFQILSGSRALNNVIRVLSLALGSAVSVSFHSLFRVHSVGKIALISFKFRFSQMETDEEATIPCNFGRKVPGRTLV